MQPRLSIKNPSNETVFRTMDWLHRRWFGLLVGVMVIYAGLPFLAPLLMELGMTGPGRVIYLIYSFLCHQLPQRSYFLFGPQLTYSLGDIQSSWMNTFDPTLLRAFTGSPEMGWKVAWSDRMVSMFTSLPVFALLWRPLRHRLPKLPWWGLGLLLLPMAVDGGTHFVSDLMAFGQGFRDTNAWLAALTGSVFPGSFYQGDALGSFNSWMRLITGLLFGLGVVWFTLPYFEASSPV